MIVSFSNPSHLRSSSSLQTGNKPISIPTFVPAAPFVLPETLVASPDRKWEANQPGETSTATTSLRLSKSDNEARRFSAWSNSANSRHFGWCKSFFMLFRLFHVRTMVTNYGKKTRHWCDLMCRCCTQTVWHLVCEQAATFNSKTCQGKGSSWNQS